MMKPARCSLPASGWQGLARHAANMYVYTCASTATIGTLRRHWQIHRKNLLQRQITTTIMSTYTTRKGFIEMLKIVPVPGTARLQIVNNGEHVRYVQNSLPEEREIVRKANIVIEREAARSKRIEAAKVALALCGNLKESRARLTKKTIIAANRARAL